MDLSTLNQFIMKFLHVNTKRLLYRLRLVVGYHLWLHKEVLPKNLAKCRCSMIRRLYVMFLVRSNLGIKLSNLVERKLLNKSDKNQYRNQYFKVNRVGDGMPSISYREFQQRLYDVQQNFINNLN